MGNFYRLPSYRGAELEVGAQLTDPRAWCSAVMFRFTWMCWPPLDVQVDHIATADAHGSFGKFLKLRLKSSACLPGGYRKFPLRRDKASEGQEATVMYQRHHEEPLLTNRKVDCIYKTQVGQSPHQLARPVEVHGEQW